jgi:hypothetical protein
MGWVRGVGKAEKGKLKAENAKAARSNPRGLLLLI